MTTEERINRIKDEIRIEPGLCLERARLYTASYKETDGLPPAFRRAKALEKIMTERSAIINDCELIVGNPTSKRVAAPILPEIAWKWYTEVMFGMPGTPNEDDGPLSDEEKAEFQELISYWDGRSLRDQWMAVVPEEYKDVEGLAWMQCSGNPSAGYYFAHCIPDFEKVLHKGILGVLDEVDARLQQLDPLKLENKEAITFLRAMKISLPSVLVWAQHLSEEAARQAAACADPERRAELELIARTCAKVPAKPADTFYEALQSVWLTYIAVMQEGWGPGIGFGRVDQYLYPYYRRDIDSGETTREKVIELIALFYLKLNELVNPFPVNAGKGSAGTLSGLTIGGVSRDGTQDSEELAMLFLDAEDLVCMIEDIVVRVHHSMSDTFLYRACQLATSVRGKIKFICDETAIKQQMGLGRTYEMAKDYAGTGCFIHTIPGKSHDPGTDAQNLPMMLELALNNGVSRLFHKKIGAETGDPRAFTSYEEVWNAYRTQLETVLPKSLIGVGYYQNLWATQLPSPLLSSLYDSCLESVRDVVDGGTAPYSSVGLWVTGAVNVGDSLAALKKVVFDDKKITMAQLIDALDKNFEGEERILRLLQNAPKFGNDIDYVDRIMDDVVCNLADTLQKYEGHAGRKYVAACATIQYNQAFGAMLGASPDGRKAGEALGEGGISPYQGRNVSGATSTVRSVAKLSLVRSAGGNVLNMKFDPSSVNNSAKMMNFVNFLRTFAETGGDLVQFNIVSNEMLRDAQEHPENYRDLLVRVATYSAYFTDLPRETQDEIIQRTSFSGF